MFLDSLRLGNNFLTTRKKEEVRYNCPYCEDEKYHLYINIKKQVFYCVRCGAKGRTNVGKNDAVFSPQETFHPALPLRLPKNIPEALTNRAVVYLKDRGILESDVTRHKLYCADKSSIYFGRIIIPCNPSHGFCDYFVARSYVKYIFPKYLNPPGGKRKLFISPEQFDSYHEQLWNNNTVMLVEGPFDFLKASRHGHTIALLGKQLSEELIKDISLKFNHVLIMLDSGIVESIAALKLHDQLINYVDTVSILVCPKKDPGEMNPKDFEELGLHNVG